MTITAGPQELIVDPAFEVALPGLGTYIFARRFGSISLSGAVALAPESQMSNVVGV